LALTIDLGGRVALVTGGVRGVGAGITRALLDAGADVVTCARGEPERLPETGSGRTPSFRVADVRDADQAQALVADVAAEHGRLDLLVNNAGGAPTADAGTASPRFHAGVVGLNLLAPLALSQAANAVMQEQADGGSILMVSSVSGLRPSPGAAAYGAAKAGLNSLAGTLSVEWGPKVRVNAIAIGPVRTELAHLYYGDEAAVARVGGTIPLGRLAEPDDVGGVCAFLASPLAAYVSGAVLLLHGGGERPAYQAVADPATDASENQTAEVAR
jgi:NAD(P)-dependent dehydrogenase (short-subunit alcohol dehydrogenase family)